MSVADDVKAAVADSIEDSELGSESELITIEMSAGAVRLLDQLIAKFGGRGGRVFAEAFALLQIAVTAQENGGHMAVIDKDDEIQETFELPLKGR